VLDADAVLREAGLDQAPSTQSDTEALEELIARRRDILIAYQDKAYAERYLRLVERVRQHESDLQPGSTPSELPLTRAAAQAYFKLLAYKDEYEVARLYSNGDFLKSVAQQFEGDYRLRFHLAPPLLARHDPVSGKPLKREFGGWMLGLMGLLARGKRLRGSALDIFGYSEERRLERALITQYEQDIDFILEKLQPQLLDSAVEMASLPLQMRGFGHVKLANIEQARHRHKLLINKLEGRDVAVELFIS
jgi:indolepyruvate ferredoxin oxidoreductase